MAQFQVDSEADSILERGGKRLHPSDTSVGAGHVRQSQQSAERLEGAERPHSSMRWRNNGVPPNSRWSSRSNRFSMR